MIEEELNMYKKNKDKLEAGMIESHIEIMDKIYT